MTAATPPSAAQTLLPYPKVVGDVYTAAFVTRRTPPAPSHLSDVRGHTRRRLLLRAVAASAAAAFLCTMPASAARGGLAGPTRPGTPKIRSVSATAIHVSGTFDCYGSTPNCTGLSPKSCTTTISAASLQSTLKSATGGGVICLNSGSTGNIALRSKTLLIGSHGAACSSSEGDGREGGLNQRPKAEVHGRW